MKTRRIETAAAAPEATADTAIALAVPGFLAAVPETNPSDIESGVTGVYLVSASSRSNNWQAQKDAGLADGDLYASVNGQIVKQMPAKFFFLKGFRSFTRMSPQGDIIGRSKERDKEHDEHFTTLLILDVNGVLYPSRSDFRSTKSGCITPAFDALVQAASPDWGKRSEQHRISQQFPHPWGRFVCSASTTPATSKSSGNRYHRGVCRIAPTSVADMERLVGAFNDPEFIAALNDATDSYLKRIEEIR